MRFIGWIVRVIQGGYNWVFTKPNEETLRRKAICKNCEGNKKIGRTHGCSRCGCEIDAKCSSPEEKCLMNKWE